MNQDPFFVIGAPRSGTTMLQLALNRHSRVVVSWETHFFTLLLRSYRGQLRHWNWIEKELQIRLAPPTGRIRPGPDARKHFWRIAEAYMERVGKDRVTHFGEKTPDHQRRISGILQTFPEAKFILIYRDGRDVALSLSKAPWMPKDLYVGFFVWLHYYRIQRRLLQQQPQRVICLRYEDLVRNPARELKLVLDFLDLDYEEKVVDGGDIYETIPRHSISYHHHALNPITSSRIGNWRRELSRKQIGRLERWGGWALRELHYQCVTDGKEFLPLWHFPVLYGRLTAEVAARGLQRKLDELFGTCLYRPNRITRDLPEPGVSRGSIAETGKRQRPFQRRIPTLNP